MSRSHSLRLPRRPKLQAACQLQRIDLAPFAALGVGHVSVSATGRQRYARRADLTALAFFQCGLRFPQCTDKRVKGIEPSCPAWEAGVLPLNYTRVSISDCGLRNADLQDRDLLPGDNVVLVRSGVLIDGRR